MNLYLSKVTDFCLIFKKWSSRVHAQHWIRLLHSLFTIFTVPGIESYINLYLNNLLVHMC